MNGSFFNANVCGSPYLEFTYVSSGVRYAEGSFKLEKVKITHNPS
jgi:hypothetical protein